MDLKGPGTDRTEFRFYGHVTRRSKIRIFVQPNLDISEAEGHVISGAGLDAALLALSGFITQAT